MLCGIRSQPLRDFDQVVPDELGWACPAGSFEATVRSARQKVDAACDYSILAAKEGKPRVRCTGGKTSWRPTSRMPRSAAKIQPIKGRCYAARGMERGKSSFEARHKEKPTSMLERLDRLGREGPMVSRLQNSHQEIGD